MSLAQFIRSQLEEILDDWSRSSRAPPGSPAPRLAGLREHGRAVLLAIAADLDTVSRSARPAVANLSSTRPVATGAATAPHEVFDAGVGDLVSTYGALRTSVLRRWMHGRGLGPEIPEDTIRFNQGFDLALSEAISRFGEPAADAVAGPAVAGAETMRELARMTRLQALSTTLVQPGDLRSLLQEILAAAAEITGTDKGNIQFLVPETGVLRIVVHQGLGPRLVEYFAEQGWSASCDAALHRCGRIIVEDVTLEPAVQGTLGLEIVLADGIRAIQRAGRDLSSGPTDRHGERRGNRHTAGPG